MPEIFATAITAVTAFLNEYRNRKIYFEGSTSPRTRLYQIVINKIYNSDNQDLIILGLRNQEWYPFEPTINFEGFLIKKIFNLEEINFHRNESCRKKYHKRERGRNYI